MARETREQRAERANAERRAQAVAEFRKRQADERAKRVYNDREAFMSLSEERPLIALYEAVGEFRRNREEFKREAERVQDRVREALQRIEEGRNPGMGTTVLNASAAEMENAAAKLEVARVMVRRLGWALGFHVPDIYTAREEAQRARFLSVSVKFDQLASERAPFGTGVWRLWVGDAPASRAMLGLKAEEVESRLAPDGSLDGELSDEEKTYLMNLPQAYGSEEAAWVAAMHYCGEGHRIY